jgi:HK97 family phage prohead protease
MNPVVRTIFTSTVKKFDKKKRTVTFFGTRESPDRTGDIVRANGIDLENFVKNPVFLWNHNTDVPAIGRVLSVTRSENGLLFEVKFAPADINEFADMIFKSFIGGFLSAVSIGFIPKDMEPIFTNDGRLVGIDIIRSELLELSAVNIPAHQDALAASMDKKFADILTMESETKAVQLEEYRKTYIEDEDMKTLEELEASLEGLKTIVKAQGETIDEQGETIKSLITLRETVDLSQKVMDTLNKSIVSLASVKTQEAPGSGNDGSMPNSPTVDPSALLKTLDGVLSRFSEKAFKVNAKSFKGDK